MRWDLCPSRRQTGICKHPTSFVSTKTFLSHYFWLGLQLTHGAGSLRRFLLPLWLQSRTRDLWTIQIRRLPWWVGPQEVANVLLSCSQETTTSSKQSRSATKCALKTTSSWCSQTNASSPLNRVHGEISANLCFFTMLSNIYQPIFVYFNALRYISANLCFFQCSQIYISQSLFSSMLSDI